MFIYIRLMIKYYYINRYCIMTCLLARYVVADYSRTYSYGSLTRACSPATIDYMRDFRCRWGEPVIVEKPKGIASDLRVTGEWAMVVRRLMNHTGVGYYGYKLDRRQKHRF